MLVITLGEAIGLGLVGLSLLGLVLVWGLKKLGMLDGD